MPRDDHAVSFDRNPFLGPDGMTLADVLATLAVSESLIPTRRRDLTSAIRSLCSLLGRDPAMVPASMREISAGLARINPSEIGVSTKTLQNRRSDVAAALRLCGATRAPHTARVTLAPDWSGLFGKLPDRRMRSGLSRLIHFCAAMGIPPGEVRDSTVQLFVHAVEAGTFVRKPSDLHRRTSRLWNEAAVCVPGWPRIRLLVPDHRKPPEHVPWETLPEPLRADIDAYLAWLSGADFLAEGGPSRPCKASTLKVRRRQLHGAASMALRSGVDGRNLQSLTDLTEPETVKVILTGYHAKNNKRITQYMIDLAELLFSAARVWVKADPAKLDALRALIRKLGPPRSGMTAKNRALVRSFEDPALLARLLHAPDRLMAEARRLAFESRKGALLAQQAVVLGILVMAPMRIGNLVSLRLDRHLVRPGGDKGTWMIEIARDETKNDQPLHYPLPEETTCLLDRYLDSYRPVLAQGHCPWLFPGEREGHKHPSTLRAQIQGQISRLVGVRMTPHQFRHLVAKLYLDRNPGQYEVVRRFLGHKSLKTTIAFYAEFETTRATRLLDDVIGDLKDGLQHRGAVVGRRQ